MKANDIRELAPVDIEKKILGCEEELFNLRYKKVTAHLEDTKRIRNVKKDLARFKTILREKELAAEGEGA